LAKNEAEAPIGYYVVDKLCDALNLPVPSVRNVADALRKQGLQAVPTLFNPRGIKSNASARQIRTLLHELVKTGHQALK